MRKSAPELTMKVKSRSVNADVKVTWRGIRWLKHLRHRWFLLLLAAWLAASVTNSLADTRHAFELERCGNAHFAELATAITGDLTPLDRTILYLSGVKGLSNARIAKIVGFDDPETIARRVKNVGAALRAKIDNVFKTSMSPEDVRHLMSCIGVALEPPEARKGSEMTGEGARMIERVRAIGPGQIPLLQANYSGLVLFASVPPGQSMRVTRPLVLTPVGYNRTDTATSQRMLVTGAYSAGITPNGDTLYMLEAYCMDHSHAPPKASDRYYFDPTHQELMSKETISTVLKEAKSDSARQDLFDTANEIRRSWIADLSEAIP